MPVAHDQRVIPPVGACCRNAILRGLRPDVYQGYFSETVAAGGANTMRGLGLHCI